MDELVAFIRRQLDEDERVARAAAETERGGQWHAVTADVSAHILDVDGHIVVYQDSLTDAQAEHVVRWDPARVLAEVEAKRRILAEHVALTEDWQADNDPVNNQSTFDITIGLEMAIRLLALPYSGRDGWREEWRFETPA